MEMPRSKHKTRTAKSRTYISVIRSLVLYEAESWVSDIQVADRWNRKMLRWIYGEKRWRQIKKMKKRRGKREIRDVYAKLTTVTWLKLRGWGCLDTLYECKTTEYRRSHGSTKMIALKYVQGVTKPMQNIS